MRWQRHDRHVKVVPPNPITKWKQLVQWRDPALYQSHGEFLLARRRHVHRSQEGDLHRPRRHQGVYVYARLNSKFAFTYGKGRGTREIAVWRRHVAGDPGCWEETSTSPEAIGSQTLATWDGPPAGRSTSWSNWGTNQNYVSSALQHPFVLRWHRERRRNNPERRKQSPTTSTHSNGRQRRWTSSVDGTVHYTYEPAVKDASTWPFDAKQYLVAERWPSSRALPPTSPKVGWSSIMCGFTSHRPQACLRRTPKKTSVLYPNPSKQNPTLRVPAEYLGGSLIVHTLDGRVIQSERLSNVQQRVDTSSLSPGVYIVEVRSPGGMGRAVRMLVE